MFEARNPQKMATNEEEKVLFHQEDMVASTAMSSQED